MEIVEYLIGSAIGCVSGLIIGYLIIIKPWRKDKEWEDWKKEHNVTEERLNSYETRGW